MTNGNGTSKFTPGAVAETIALAGPGEEVPSGFAPFKQMRYNLVDGRTWYAALKIGVKLANLELAAGEPFRVCKRPFGNGGSVIDVMRCSVTATPPPEQGGTVLEAKLAASIAAAKQPKVDSFTPQWRPPELHAPVNGNGQVESSFLSLDQAMKAAIDVCVRGEKYAAAKGLAIRFLAEDIRAICITLVIGQQKEEC